jgi:hypothetical protein
VRRLLILLIPLGLALPPHDAAAQIIRTGRFRVRDPQWWVSGGAGWQQGFTVMDGTTDVRWDLSDALQYHAAVEHTVSGGTTVGVRANTGRVSMNYVPRLSTAATQADVNVTQAYAMLHVGNGRTFRTVIELGVGATVYSDFRARSTHESLAPTSPDADFAFVFGYGFGYSVSKSFEIDAVQDLATSLHQKSGLSAGDNSSTHVSSTRLVARFGLGS